MTTNNTPIYNLGPFTLLNKKKAEDNNKIPAAPKIKSLSDSSNIDFNYVYNTSLDNSLFTETKVTEVTGPTGPAGPSGFYGPSGGYLGPIGFSSIGPTGSSVHPAFKSAPFVEIDMALNPILDNNQWQPPTGSVTKSSTNIVSITGLDPNMVIKLENINGYIPQLGKDSDNNYSIYYKKAPILEFDI